MAQLGPDRSDAVRHERVGTTPAPPRGDDNPIWTTALWAAGSALIGVVVTAVWTRGTKISEFRQAWIIDLRQDIAAFLGGASLWRHLREQAERSVATEPDAKDLATSLQVARREARVILWRIKLRFNPRPNKFKAEDDAFLAVLDALIDGSHSPREPTWDALALDAENRAREILKREWQVTKRRWPRRASAVGSLPTSERLPV